MNTYPPVAALFDEARTGRTFHGIQQERKQPAAEAVDALLDVFARNDWPTPRVVLVGRPTDVHQRRDGVVVRVAGQHEPVIRPGEFFAEIQAQAAHRRI